MRVHMFALLLMAGLAAPALATGQSQISRPVTVEQLEQILATAHGKHDRELNKQLSGLTLSERLSAERLAQIETELPGPASRNTLMEICDEAGFLNLPARDLPTIAPPDTATQNSMLTLMVKYVNQTAHALPNFFATQETTHFETKSWMQPARSGQAITHEPLLPLDSSTDTVYYRDGREYQQSNDAKKKIDDTSQSKMETNGEFGPILTVVLDDALHGKVTWSHWEQSSAGLMAVFSYSVARKSSHYSVFNSDPRMVVQDHPAYHGEIAANPADGSILRITVQADFVPSEQNARADLLVEYGSIEIGNRTYICPVKSVALSMVRNSSKDFALRIHIDDNLNFFRMRINDTRFTHYHLFHAEVRMLTEDDAAADGPSPAPSPDGVPTAEPAKAPQP